MRQELRIGGFGGQGVISAGRIIGQAAVLFDGKQATFTQSYGPEARGGACAAEVVVSDTAVTYPLLTIPDVTVLMSQEAYEKYASEIKPGGIVIVDPDLVNHEEREDMRLFPIPATRIAESLGRRIVANVVMLGALAAIARSRLSASSYFPSHSSISRTVRSIAIGLTLYCPAYLGA